MINPPPKTRYQEKLRELNEAIYGSRQKAPFGRSQVIGPGLPNGLDPEKTTFGVKVLHCKIHKKTFNILFGLLLPFQPFLVSGHPIAGSNQAERVDVSQATIGLKILLE